MLAVNGHAKHRQSLCRVGYGKTALSMDLFFITTANILSNHTFLLLSRNQLAALLAKNPDPGSRGEYIQKKKKPCGFFLRCVRDSNP